VLLSAAIAARVGRILIAGETDFFASRGVCKILSPADTCVQADLCRAKGLELTGDRRAHRLRLH
jgi:hypothetical protein